VVINGEVFFSAELETLAGIVPAEVTVANFLKIDGVLYNRVFFKRNLEADMLIGYLREDPGTGQIYFRETTDPQEFLVYDITLEEGDNITLNARWCDGLAGDVATVTSVTETEGRREVTFNREVGDGNICQTLTFLEGVGPSASVIFPYFRDAIAENGTAVSICHASHDNVIYYPEGGTTDFCGSMISSEEEPLGANLEVFPNPVSNVLYLRGLPAAAELDFFNANGQKVLLPFDGETLNTSALVPGLYLLRIRLTDGTVLIRKVVK
jgi:hypothetical protein